MQYSSRGETRPSQPDHLTQLADSLITQTFEKCRGVRGLPLPHTLSIIARGAFRFTHMRAFIYSIRNVYYRQMHMHEKDCIYRAAFGNIIRPR